MAGFSFDRQTAGKLYKLAHSTQEMPSASASNTQSGAQILGSVVADVAAGTTASPTAGTFNPIYIDSSGNGTIGSREYNFKNPYGRTFSAGDVVVMADCGRYHIPTEGNAGGEAGTGYGTLTSALASSDATASVTLDASSPLEPNASITATNWVGMDGASGAKCIVSKTGTEYVLIQLACPAP